MIALLFAALLGTAASVSIPDVVGAYMSHADPVCRVNVLTCANVSIPDKVATCAALTTHDDCEGNAHCWWDDAVATNGFIDKNNALWDLANQTVANPIPGVHSLFGFHQAAMAAPTIVETTNYVILINAGQNTEASLAVKDYVEENIGKPIRWLIITHAHPDEFMDSSSIYTPGQNLTVITPLAFFQDLALQQAIGPTNMNPPSIPGGNLIRNFGMKIPRDTNWRLSEPLNFGGSPLLCSYGPMIFPPVPGLDCLYLQTFPYSTTLDGLPVTFVLTPGDLAGQVSVYFPTKKFLHAADAMLTMFPPLTTYRGDPVRPVDRWITSLQTLLALQNPPSPGWEYIAASSLPLLAPPLSYQSVSGLLTLLQYIQAHTLNGIRNNVPVDDIEASFAVPDYIQAQLAPFYPLFTEMYHHIGLTIRGAVLGYIGAADTTYTGMRVVPVARQWQDVITLAGDAAHAIQIAKQHVSPDASREDLLFALQVGEALKGTNNEVADARLVMYQACYQLAMKENGYTARNFYLTCAWENKPVGV